MPRLATDVKVFRYTDQGAPVLKGAAGFLQDLLYACLVTGYGSTTVSSVTRDGSEVTVTINAGHTFPKHSVIELSGANESGYNGTHRIESVTSTTFKFVLPSDVTPSTPATGTITVKMASAGWTRSYVSGDGLRAVYKSSDLQALGFYLYVDDQNTWTRRAGAKGYETVTGIDSRVNPFPYSAADDQWVWWYKSDDDNTARPWCLVADSRMFYLWVNANSSNLQRLYAFGDILPAASIDAWACVVSGHGSSSDNNYCGGLTTITRPSSIPAGSYRARGPSGTSLGQAVCAGAFFVPASSVTYARELFPACIGGQSLLASPSFDGALVLSNVFLQDSGVHLCGTLPGVYQCLQSLTDLSDLTVVPTTEDVYIVMTVASSKALYESTETGPRQGRIAISLLNWR